MNPPNTLSRFARTIVARFLPVLAIGLFTAGGPAVHAQDPALGEDPYVPGGAAPLLSGIEGGPAAVGLLPGVVGDFPDLQDYVKNAPAGATEVLLVLKTAGPVTAPNGYSLAVLINLGTKALKSPVFSQAIGPGAPPLVIIPPAGGQSQPLAELAAGRVYLANLPDTGGNLLEFGHDGQLFTAHAGVGQFRFDLAPATLPGTTCYGAIPYAGNAASVLVYNTNSAAGLLGNLLPSTWTANAYQTLDASAGGTDWQVNGIMGNAGPLAVAGSSAVAGTRQAVVWTGSPLATTGLHPGPTYAASAANGIWTDGANVAVAGTYVVGGSEVTLPARWDLRPSISPAYQFTPLDGGSFGGKANGVADTVVVGSVNGIFGPVPVIWSGGSRFNLNDPATAAPPFGGEALAIDSLIVGYVNSGGIQRATAWASTFVGFIGADLHPAGFLASSAVATRGNFVAGTGRDAAGAEHVLLWDANSAQATDLTPYLPGNPGTARPTAIDDQGNVSVTVGDGFATRAYLLVRGTAGISEPFLIKIGKTNLIFTVDVTPQCEGATVRASASLGGVVVSTWESPAIAAGGGSINLRPELTQLTAETEYVVQTLLVRPSGDPVAAPSVTVRTQAKNLPPFGNPLELTYQVGVPRFLSEAELIAGAIDPEGDAISVDRVEGMDGVPLDATGAAGARSYAWIPPAPDYSGTVQFRVYLRDSQGAQAERDVRLAPLPPAPAVGAVVVTADGLGFRFTGDAGRNYRIDATDSLAAPVVWTPLGSAVAGADGNISVTGLVVAKTGQRYFRAVSL